jgi:hypothetical protein
MGWLAAFLLTGQVYWCDVDGERRMQDWPCDEDQPRAESQEGGGEPAWNPADGQPTKLPDIDIDAACREIRRASGSYSAENYCRERQREARAELMGRIIPPEILEHCNELGRSAESYSALKYCVERETRAKQAQGRP